MTGGPDLALGTVLDGIYRIDRLLGQGGMGSVYQATQTRLDKRVAIESDVPGFWPGIPRPCSGSGARPRSPRNWGIRTSFTCSTSA